MGTGASRWSTPMGERQATLSGEDRWQRAHGQPVGPREIRPDIFDGTVNGNEASWKVSITEPHGQ